MYTNFSRYTLNVLDPIHSTKRKTNLRKCVQCTKVIGQPYKLTDPPPVPKDRVSECRPFSITWVDYDGPILVKKRQTQQMYICLFTCATVRTIHLKQSIDLSTDTFFLAFISNKGTTLTMHFDNGTTFIAAHRTIMQETRIALSGSSFRRKHLGNKVSGKEWLVLRKQHSNQRTEVLKAEVF